MFLSTQAAKGNARTRIAILAAAGAVSFGSISLGALPPGWSHQLQLRGNLAANPGPSFNVPHGTTLNSTTVALNNNGAIATKLSTIGTTSNQGIWYGPGDATGGIVATGPDSLTALWSDVALGDTGRIVVPVEASGLVETVDIYGVKSTLPVKNGAVEIALTGAPQYLTLKK